MWDEWLVVNGVYIPNAVDPLKHAWRYIAPGLSDLEQAAPLRDDEGLVVPGAAGRYPLLTTIDELVAQIPLQIRGWYDLDGDPYTDPRQGRIDNTSYLKENLGLADADSPGDLVSLIWHQPDGTELTGSTFVSLVGYEKKSDTVANTVLRLRISAGVLTPSGS